MNKKRNLVIKNRVKELRIERGLSQITLAEMSRTTQNTISQIENGKYSPTLYLAMLIVNALDCKVEDCFYFEMEDN